MMKKLFMLFTAVISMAVIVSSCSKPEKPDNNGDDNGNGNEEVTEALITVDGEFADWIGLPNVAVSEVPEDAAYVSLITMKAVADKTNVYLYFEFEPADEQTKAPITIEFDADDDPSSGLTDFHWADVGWDYALESSAGFLGNGNYVKINDFKLLKPMAGYDGQARTWDPSNCTDGAAKGVKNKGKTVNGLLCFEMNVPRTLIKADKKGTLRVATYVENQDWQEVGLLPIDDGLGMTEMMEVSLP